MSATMCKSAQKAAPCACSPLSPFRWAESYTPGSSFAADWPKNAASSQASTKAVERQRADGIDPGYISGLNTPMHHVRPSDKTARAKKRADSFKPTTFTVYSKARAAKK